MKNYIFKVYLRNIELSETFRLNFYLCHHYIRYRIPLSKNNDIRKYFLCDSELYNANDNAIFQWYKI